MRDRMLHDALLEFTREAGELLDQRLAVGEEIPFEVADAAPGRDGGVSLVAYRPLTSEFITRHAERLRSLESFAPAASALERTRGMRAYLRVREEAAPDVSEATQARLGALAFIAAVWEGAEQFEFLSERFRHSYLELEAVALASRLVTTAFVPVYGVSLEAPLADLGGGVEIVSPEDVEPDCAAHFAADEVCGDAFLAISIAAASDAPLPINEIHRQAREALAALRLFKAGSVTLGIAGHAFTAGTWRAMPFPFTGRARGGSWDLLAAEHDDLRQFMAAVRRVGRRSRISWALNRFELGLERTVPVDGLSDFLLALRALLEVQDDAGLSALPVRVAALCAQEGQRPAVERNLELAFALERLAMDSCVERRERKELEAVTPLAVIAQIESHLRALLHDLVCGYLALNLREMADDILTSSARTDFETGQPTYAPPVEQAPQFYAPITLPPQQQPEPMTQQTQQSTIEFEAVFDDTAQIAAVDQRADIQTGAFGEPAQSAWSDSAGAEPLPATAGVEPIDPPAFDARQYEAPAFEPPATRRPGRVQRPDHRLQEAPFAYGEHAAFETGAAESSGTTLEFGFDEVRASGPADMESAIANLTEQPVDEQIAYDDYESVDHGEYYEAEMEDEPPLQRFEHEPMPPADPPPPQFNRNLPAWEDSDRWS